MRIVRTIPKIGDTRIKKRFLIFPKATNNGRDENGRFIIEVRWLEHATWQEVYVSDYGGSGWHFEKYLD